MTMKAHSTPKTPKVLFVADVGSTDYGFYHIGDEAMMLQTYFWYKKYFPWVEIGLLSRSYSHSSLSLTEGTHFLFPEETWQTRFYLLRLIRKDLFLRFFKRNIFSQNETAFRDYVLEFDGIHFTGGGNLYSHYRPWLYYAFFLIYLGKISSKQVWLTSQTLGPLSGVDRIFAHIFLSLPDLIAIREPLGSKSLFTPFLYRRRIHRMLDAAYELPAKSRFMLPRTTRLRIGLSLHEWKGFEDRLQEVVLSALQDLSTHAKIELVLLPHILVKRHADWDMKYMQKLTKSIPSSVRIIVPSYTKFTKSASAPELTVKSLTKQVDILITTRYHGVVFGLSENTPVLTFSMGEYYTQKNFGALRMVYKHNADKYIVDLADKNATVLLQSKLKSIIQNLQSEKSQLRTLVFDAKKNEKLFTLHSLRKKLQSFSRQ